MLTTVLCRSGPRDSIHIFVYGSRVDALPVCSTSTPSSALTRSHSSRAGCPPSSAFLLSSGGLPSTSGLGFPWDAPRRGSEMSMAPRAIRPTKPFSLRDARTGSPFRVRISVLVPYHACPSQAALALVVSPRLAPPSSSTSYSPPYHGRLRAEAPSSTNHLQHSLCLGKSARLFVWSVSPQHGPRAGAKEYPARVWAARECRMRATTPRWHPCSESFYTPRGTSRVQCAPSFFSGADLPEASDACTSRALGGGSGGSALPLPLAQGARLPYTALPPLLVHPQHVDFQLPVFLVSYYRWSFHPATLPRLSLPPQLPRLSTSLPYSLLVPDARHRDAAFTPAVSISPQSCCASSVCTDAFSFSGWRTFAESETQNACGPSRRKQDTAPWTWKAQGQQGGGREGAGSRADQDRGGRGRGEEGYDGGEGMRWGGAGKTERRTPPSPPHSTIPFPQSPPSL
ncbi:hypothetical protein K438DRAFT_1986777 [Mycena galopus ATCC 62051]|nr:hypothetical protein K438DRAFT_1986777 [Mycena galopus ATCC 62051]